MNLKLGNYTKEMVQIFSIEGNIGSGKSTLIRCLKKINKDIIFVLEPVDEWATITDLKGENILTKFYRNQSKYSFSFQMMAYISRLSKLKKVVAQNPNAIIITERSILTDKNVFAKMLYDDKHIEEVDYTIYLKWFDEFIEDVTQTGFIYIKSYPHICMQRVEKRNRSGEVIALSYLERCHQYHENWLAYEKNILLLDGNVEFKEDTEVLIQWNKKICEFISLDHKKCSLDKLIDLWKYSSHC